MSVAISSSELLGICRLTYGLADAYPAPPDFGSYHVPSKIDVIILLYPQDKMWMRSPNDIVAILLEPAHLQASL